VLTLSSDTLVELSYFIMRASHYERSTDLLEVNSFIAFISVNYGHGDHDDNDDDEKGSHPLFIGRFL
jgi:hypothetical protein